MSEEGIFDGFLDEELTIWVVAFKDRWEIRKESVNDIGLYDTLRVFWRN